MAGVQTSEVVEKLAQSMCYHKMSVLRELQNMNNFK
jgi:hypothetical protein